MLLSCLGVGGDMSARDSLFEQNLARKSQKLRKFKYVAAHSFSRCNACNGSYSAFYTNSSLLVALRMYVDLWVLYRTIEIGEASFGNFNSESRT
jgi:hypothetical protein